MAGSALKQYSIGCFANTFCSIFALSFLAESLVVPNAATIEREIYRGTRDVQNAHCHQIVAKVLSNVERLRRGTIHSSDASCKPKGLHQRAQPSHSLPDQVDGRIFQPVHRAVQTIFQEFTPLGQMIDQQQTLG
jgi:hypothetical protein